MKTAYLNFNHTRRVLARGFGGALLAFALQTGFAKPDPDAAALSGPSAKGLEQLKAIQLALGADALPQAEALANEMIATALVPSFDAAVARLLKVQVLLSSERFADTVAPLEEALAMGTLPADSIDRSWRTLAQVYYQLGRLSDGEAKLSAYLAGAEDPSTETLQLHAVLALQSGKPEIAVETCQRILNTLPEPPAEVYHLTAAALQAAGLFADASPYLERLAQMDPGNADYWSQLMASYYQAGNLWGAISALDRAQERGVKKEPRDNLLRAEMYYNLELHEQAAKLIEEGLDSGAIPSELDVWLLLVYCQELLKRPDLALETLRKASEATPFPEIDIRLAETAWKESDPAATIAYLDSAFAKGNVSNPADAWTLYAAAAVSDRRARLAERAIEEGRSAGADPKKLDQLQQAVEQLRLDPNVEAAAEHPNANETPL